MGQLIINQFAAQECQNSLGVVSIDGKLTLYGEFVATLAKDMNDPVLDRLHAAVGMAGEAGELLDAIKKNWAYGRTIDRANVLEELGDMFFYAQAMMILMNFSFQDVLTANKDKLLERYSGMVYTDAAAIERADKVVTGETTASGIGMIDGRVQAINVTMAPPPEGIAEPPVATVTVTPE